VVDPDRVDTLDPTPTPSLTLVTCYPFAFVGRAPQRFVVRARQVKAPEVPIVAQARAARSPTVLMAAGR
jgi:sortase (surface protein transpeptidase)